MMWTTCSPSQEVVDLNFRKKHIRETFSASKDNERNSEKHETDYLERLFYQFENL